jgi:hypothetical protein
MVEDQGVAGNIKNAISNATMGSIKPKHVISATGSIVRGGFFEEVMAQSNRKGIEWKYQHCRKMNSKNKFNHEVKFVQCFVTLITWYVHKIDNATSEQIQYRQNSMSSWYGKYTLVTIVDHQTTIPGGWFVVAVVCVGTMLLQEVSGYLNDPQAIPTPMVY